LLLFLFFGFWKNKSSLSFPAFLSSNHFHLLCSYTDEERNKAWCKNSNCITRMRSEMWEGNMHDIHGNKFHFQRFIENWVTSRRRKLVGKSFTQRDHQPEIENSKEIQRVRYELTFWKMARWSKVKERTRREWISLGKKGSVDRMRKTKTLF
jgi:hypothetical protein